MTAASLLSLVSGILEAVKHFPSVAHAIGDLVHAVAGKTDPTPAMRKLEGEAAIAFLEIEG